MWESTLLRSAGDRLVDSAGIHLAALGGDPPRGLSGADHCVAITSVRLVAIRLGD
ncbi:MAG: hypothetical protein V3S62_04770 [Acidimicrobiia bacterium]